ncbi:MAG: YfhO family protein [Phototrophicaceae bacterium]
MNVATVAPRRLPVDVAAVGALLLLWLLFFWRLFTPTPADQLSLVHGDFSRQFVTFGAYQHERFSAGDVPLWNPYNNGGLPFIADTQAAVFYPPRLLTIALSNLSGSGWTYNALQLEMTAHVLLYTLLMYAFVRRLTLGRAGSAPGAFVAALVAGYGGFMTGYPPLQLALLEAAIWLPLALLAVLEATRTAFRWPWLALAGLALGFTWLAGHPQTGWFATYTLVAYLAWRVYTQRLGWRVFILALALVGMLTAGIAAVTLLPGLEYLTRTARSALSFDDKGGGFPFHDIAQMLVPGAVSLWSPLFAGVTGLALAGIGLAARDRERLFWGGLALVALGLSFGARSALFHALYNTLPGLSYFRGQERAAYLVSVSVAVLAGLGVVALATPSGAAFLRRVRYAVAALALVIGGLALLVFALWTGAPDAYGHVIEPLTFSALIAGLLLALLWRDPPLKHMAGAGLLVTLVVFELFSVNMGGPGYEARPADAQPIMQTPPLVSRILDDTDGPYRIDGSHDLPEAGPYGSGNGGSLYGVQDIRGISPLFLRGPHRIIERGMPSEVAWELFAVRYVITPWEELPLTPSQIVARDYPAGQTLNLHRLDDPRPFALLLADVVVVPDDDAAYTLLADPDFDSRQTVILEDEPAVLLPEAILDDARATVTDFGPERITVEIESSSDAVLSLALVDYPGWRARLNGESIPTLRAYGALTAVSVPAGAHTLTLTYSPLSYHLGAIFSLVTWVGLAILGLLLIVNRRKRHAID